MAANVTAADDCFRHLKELLLDTLGIKVCTPEHLQHFDLLKMELPGAHPNVAIVVDHHTIEQHASRLLTELHRYDLPT